jgi:S-adenosylmethionine hydrolase
MKNVITLLTDFGTADSYVGVMKGVMIGIDPNAGFIDISHSIPPGDIKKAAFRLFTAHKYFPASTIHLVVVDPGVGTERKPIIVRTKAFCFVGPDNGVFSWIYRREEFTVYEIIREKNRSISNTFHGRDVFAPAAAKLSAGAKPEELGVRMNTWITFQIPVPKPIENGLKAEIIDIDRFGNLITSVSGSDFKALIAAEQEIPSGNSICKTREALTPGSEVRIKGHVIRDLKTSYQGKDPIAILGSSDFLEISLPNGNCAEYLDVGVGTELTVTAAPSDSALQETVSRS